MEFVTIPFDYDELPAASQSAIVPICIARDDEEGKPIAWEWFEAIARIPDRLRNLARRHLDDVWRASEISEWALHKIWRLHGRDLGRAPEYRVYAHAAWRAKDLRAGSWHERRGVVIALEGLETVIRDRILADKSEYERAYQRRLDFKALSERLVEEGLEDVSEMLDLLRDGCTWDEVGERFGRTADAARVRFRRKTAGIIPEWPHRKPPR